MSIYQRKGRKTWVVDNVWPDKVRTRIPAPTKAAAERINLKIRAASIDERRVWLKLRSELGIAGGEERLQGFSELADKYIAEYVMSNNRNSKAKILRLNAMSRHFGGTPINAITVRHADAYVAMRNKQGIKNNTNNYDITILKHVFSWAKKRRYIEFNPMGELEKLREVERVGERPDESVIDEIFANLPAVAVPLLTFIRETGCRHAEATLLTWDKVDYTKATVTFHTTTKNGKSRQVPLTAAALAALSALPRCDKLVFYHTPKGVIKKWSATQLDMTWRKATGKVMVGTGADARPSRLRIHDLRHAYAVRLAESGCPMHFISEVLGHSNTDFTRKKYARFSPESASRAVLKVLEGRR